ncbi:hypothetical protein [Amycolatopsis sp. NPDC004079]|uniref:Uncharacterized protein n=1 Tax=Amycolatopsis halotolerans TaxID=330083 RepID=A0ABV7QCG5_9PSEU
MGGFLFDVCELQYFSGLRTVCVVDGQGLIDGLEFHPDHPEEGGFDQVPGFDVDGAQPEFRMADGIAPRAKSPVEREGKRRARASISVRE